MVALHLFALAILVADAARCLAGVSPVGYINVAAEHLERPAVKRQFKRVKKAAGERVALYVDRKVAGMNESSSSRSNGRSGGFNDILYDAFRLQDVSGDFDSERSGILGRLGNKCGSSNWYYRQSIAPHQTPDSMQVQPLANEDYEVVNDNDKDALTLKVTKSKASVLSLAARWNVERANMKAWEDGSTSTTEKGQTSSQDSTTSGGGSAGGGFNFGIWSGQAEGHVEHGESQSQGNSLSQSQGRTKSSSASTTQTGGQGQESTATHEFVDDVTLESECPAKSICSVQTWTFTLHVSGHCPSILYYDFEPCLRGQPSPISIFMETLEGDDDKVVLPDPGVQLSSKLAMSSIIFSSQDIKSIKAGNMSARYFSYNEYPDTNYRVWDGLTVPTNDTGIEYKHNPRCNLTYPALLPNGTPHRVQFLFVQPIDNGHDDDDDDDDGKSSSKRKLRRAVNKDKAQVYVLRSTLDQVE